MHYFLIIYSNNSIDKWNSTNLYVTSWAIVSQKKRDAFLDVIGLIILWLLGYIISSANLQTFPLLGNYVTKVVWTAMGVHTQHGVTETRCMQTEHCYLQAISALLLANTTNDKSKELFMCWGGGGQGNSPHKIFRGKKEDKDYLFVVWKMWDKVVCMWTYNEEVVPRRPGEHQDRGAVVEDVKMEVDAAPLILLSITSTINTLFSILRTPPVHRDNSTYSEQTLCHIHSRLGSTLTFDLGAFS